MPRGTSFAAESPSKFVSRNDAILHLAICNRPYDLILFHPGINTSLGLGECGGLRHRDIWIPSNNNQRCVATIQAIRLMDSALCL
jgi:hypothetical protein